MTGRVESSFRITETCSPFYIKTNFQMSPQFFASSFDFKEGWVDADILYKDSILEATRGRPTKNFYVKEIKPVSAMCLKLIAQIFNLFSIKSRDFRCDFFKIQAGGELPYHVDEKSKVSLCLPVTSNPCETFFRLKGVEHKLSYDCLVLLNTLVEHKVAPPFDERVVFRIGVHDLNFEEVVLNLQR